MSRRLFDRDEAATLHAEGATYVALARRYGVTPQAVGEALAGHARRPAAALGDVWRNLASGRGYTVKAVADGHVKIAHTPGSGGYWMSLASLERHYRKET